MDLKNTYLHKRNTSVLVNGNTYQIDGKGIATGVLPEDARKLLGDKKAWMIIRQPVEAVEPEAAAPAVLPVPEPERVPTEPVLETPQPMPGPGPELIPTGAAEAALPTEKPQEPVVEEKAPPAPMGFKPGPGRPKKR